MLLLLAVQACSGETQTPLHKAVESGEGADVIKQLIADGADVNAKGEYDETPLHYAVWFGAELSIVEALIDAGADVNARDEYDGTPLHDVESSSGAASIVEALLAAGADVSARDWIDATPLHYIAQNNELASIEMLLAAGADVNARDEDDATPLHYAVWHGVELPVAEDPVYADSDVNASDEDGESPMHHAELDSAAPSIVETLIEAGADVNARDDSGATPLNYALAGGVIVSTGLGGHRSGSSPAVPLIKALLEAGADVNTRGGHTGFTPLHGAVFHQEPSIVEMLLAAGADVNAYDDLYGITPLHGAAVWSAEEDIVEALLAAGADVNAVTKEPSAWLRISHNMGYMLLWSITMIDKMFGDDADGKVSVTNMADVWQEGNTPLLLALYRKSGTPIIETLLDAGADVNMGNKEGVTPSHLANNRLFPQSTLEALVAAGADIDVDDRSTIVSSEVVRYYGNMDDISHYDEALIESRLKGDVWAVSEETDFSTGERDVFSSYSLDAYTENEISIKVTCSSMTVLYKNEEAHDTQEARVSAKARINSNDTIVGEAYVERVEPRPCESPPGDSCGCPDAGEQGVAYHLDESMFREMLQQMHSGNALLLQLEDRDPLSIGLLNFGLVYWHMQQSLGSPTYCAEQGKTFAAQSPGA